MSESDTLLAPPTQVLPHIVQEHALEAALLFIARCRLTTANDVRLEGLARHDQRIEAHFDGVRVAGDGARAVLMQMMSEAGCGEMFVLGALALGRGDIEQFRLLLQRAQANPETLRGIFAALGWSASGALRGIAIEMLHAADVGMRLAATVACSMHRVEPRLPARLQDEDPQIRARALRMAGELGSREWVSRLAADAMQDADPVCRFWATWSAVLCGDRQRGLAGLAELAFASGPDSNSALQVLLQASRVEVGHALLQQHARDPAAIRSLIVGAGFIGDPSYVPWLIGQIENVQTARLAGRALSLITGLDLWQPPFFRQPPDDFASGPTEDPEDENVAMDDDDGLPWPDPLSIQAWWEQNGARFTPGVRHFMGKQPNREHCIEVLKDGYQRQRIAAAYHLCLLNPGTPLFEWRAPAWRQQRVLAQMS